MTIPAFPAAIYSMTGFAQMQGETGSGGQEASGFSLTLKGVNHRFLDLSFRLPPQCDELEMDLRRVLKESLRRGHVDVTLQWLRAESTTHLQLNHELLTAHVNAYRGAAKEFGLTAEPDLNAILRQPGVLRSDTVRVADDPAALRSAVILLLPDLLGRFNHVRAQEGGSLAEQLRAAMLRLRAATVQVVELRKDSRGLHVERLRRRMEELLEATSFPEDRLLAEAALLAERSDVDEELARLEIHTTRFLALLDEGGELGKRLDFLLQELNREANTLLSKTSGATVGNGLQITELGLQMKLEIEKAREQVQNLE